MALPDRTPEERKAALAKAMETRKARAEVKAKLKRGELRVSDALAADAAQRMYVLDLVRSLPGYGKAKAERVMKLLAEFE